MTRNAVAAAPPEAAGFVCRHCGSGRSRVRYTFSGVDKVIRECLSCSLMVLDPLPTEEELKAVYNEGYFENEDLARTDVSKVYGYVDYISERINKQKGYADVCRTLKRLVISSRTSPKLLDLGCGLAFFLDTAFEAGFDVHGVEFNEYAIEYIRRRYAYPVSRLGELDPADRFDVITMFDVIEHLREPFEALDEARDRLEDNGLLVIVTMDSTSVTSRLMGKRLEDFRRISEHLFFFSRSNMIDILRRRGFDFVGASSKGHSFEVRLLATRLRAVLPVLGAPLSWLVSAFPFLGRASIYVNPRTKFILYARKRPSPKIHRLRSCTLSVIVPVHNESITVAGVIDRLLALDLGLDKEIVVVDDGSTDATSEILEDYRRRGAITLLTRPHQGKGAAVAAGIRVTTGEFVAIQDADAEYDPADLAALVRTAAETGALAVYGSRYSGRFRKTGGLIPTLGNTLLTWCSNVVNGSNLSDMMTGAKLFDGTLIRGLGVKSSGFEFEAEVTCRLRRKGVPIYEVPVSYNARSYLEGKKIRVRDGWAVLRAIGRYGLLGAE